MLIRANERPVDTIDAGPRKIIAAVAALAVALALTVGAVNADDETISQEEAESHGAVAPDSVETPAYTYLASQWTSNLATFDMIERYPPAFNEPAPAMEQNYQEEIALFDAMERAPGAYTGDQEQSSRELDDLLELFENMERAPGLFTGPSTAD